MKEFLTFKKMITPIFVQVLFWVGFAFLLYIGILIILHRSYIFGALVIVVAPIFLRVACEAIIILFRINDNLKNNY
jgi:hypothetical protein